jgi:polyhydroxyalkanoate synthesis regulator phasin
MEVSQVTNPAIQQLFDALNPQDSTSTSNSQVTNTGTQGVQGHHHHHHHHKSMAAMISKLESIIDDAVKGGKLTDDQAAQMKKELESITETLKQGQSSSGAQLTPDDLQKIRTEFQDVRKQLFDVLNPQGSPSTSNPQVTNTDIQSVQGHHHHHHHHKSMADMISKMESIIDDAAKAGKLTDDQATQMKKELDSITETLKQGQSSSGAELTPDDLQNIRTEFQDVRRQLFDALNPQKSTSAPNGIGDALFKKMDANGDGTIDKNEFSTFINALL